MWSMRAISNPCVPVYDSRVGHAFLGFQRCCLFCTECSGRILKVCQSWCGLYFGELYLEALRFPKTPTVDTNENSRIANKRSWENIPGNYEYSRRSLACHLQKTFSLLSLWRRQSIILQRCTLMEMQCEIEWTEDVGRLAFPCDQHLFQKLLLSNLPLQKMVAERWNHHRTN